MAGSGTAHASASAHRSPCQPRTSAQSGSCYVATHGGGPGQPPCPHGRAPRRPHWRWLPALAQPPAHAPTAPTESEPALPDNNIVTPSKPGRSCIAGVVTPATTTMVTDHAVATAPTSGSGGQEHCHPSTDKLTGRIRRGEYVDLSVSLQTNLTKAGGQSKGSTVDPDTKMKAHGAARGGHGLGKLQATRWPRSSHAKGFRHGPSDVRLGQLPPPPKKPYYTIA